MDLWDQDAVDLMGSAIVEINADGTGMMRFIAVEAVLDHRAAQRDGRAAIEFTWVGIDVGTPVSGRGWIALADADTIEGHIWFHMGDDSGFVARRHVLADLSTSEASSPPPVESAMPTSPAPAFCTGAQRHRRLCPIEPHGAPARVHTMWRPIEVLQAAPGRTGRARAQPARRTSVTGLSYCEHAQLPQSRQRTDARSAGR